MTRPEGYPWERHQDEVDQPDYPPDQEISLRRMYRQNALRFSLPVSFPTIQGIPSNSTAERTKGENEYHG